MTTTPTRSARIMSVFCQARRSGDGMMLKGLRFAIDRRVYVVGASASNKASHASGALLRHSSSPIMIVSKSSPLWRR